MRMRSSEALADMLTAAGTDVNCTVNSVDIWASNAEIKRQGAYHCRDQYCLATIIIKRRAPQRSAGADEIGNRTGPFKLCAVSSPQLLSRLFEPQALLSDSK